MLPRPFTLPTWVKHSGPEVALAVRAPNHPHFVMSTCQDHTTPQNELGTMDKAVVMSLWGSASELFLRRRTHRPTKVNTLVSIIAPLTDRAGAVQYDACARRKVGPLPWRSTVPFNH